MTKPPPSQSGDLNLGPKGNFRLGGKEDSLPSRGRSREGMWGLPVSEEAAPLDKDQEAHAPRESPAT